MDDTTDNVMEAHQVVLIAAAKNDVLAAQAALKTFQQALRDGYAKQQSESAKK